MHEMSIAQSIADIARDEAARHTAHCVKTIFVDVGALSCVDSHALTFGFEAVVNGTSLEGAELSISTIPAEAYCFDCEATVSVAHKGAGCPNCGSRKLMVTQGEDLKVREMEII